MAISLVSSSLTLMDEPAHFTLSDLSLHVETIRITTNGSQAVFFKSKTTEHKSEQYTGHKQLFIEKVHIIKT